MLPLNLSDTASTSQDGSPLEFIAAIAGRQCYIQDASDRGLCLPPLPNSITAGAAPTEEETEGEEEEETEKERNNRSGKGETKEKNENKVPDKTFEK